MRLKYDSKKPRRVEVVVYQDDVLDVPKHIGEPLALIAGFVPTDETVQLSPFEHLEAVADAIPADGPERDQLVNAVQAFAAAIADIPAADEPVAFDPADHKAADVVAYATEHPGEASAVLAAEQAGKNRKKLTADLQAVIEAAAPQTVKVETVVESEENPAEE